MSRVCMTRKPNAARGKRYRSILLISKHRNIAVLFLLNVTFEEYLPKPKMQHEICYLNMS